MKDLLYQDGKYYDGYNEELIGQGDMNDFENLHDMLLHLGIRLLSYDGEPPLDPNQKKQGLLFPDMYD